VLVLPRRRSTIDTTIQVTRSATVTMIPTVNTSHSGIKASKVGDAEGNSDAGRHS
jgi:hypothetical protein